MTSQPLPFYERVDRALHDQTLQTALGRTANHFVGARSAALAALADPDALRDQARACR